MRRMNIARRQNPQSQQIREEYCIILIVRVFQTVIAFHRHRVRQFDVQARSHKAVDQPISVVRRLDHHAAQLVTVQIEESDYQH